ncbi:hypothetical protein VWM73_12715, partial [Campylobacter coli]
TKEQYEAIRSNIGNFAIEDMFLNEKDIIDNVKIIKGEATANESQKIMSDEQKYLKILNNMKLNQARFDYNDKLWQFNDFDFN